MLKKHLKKILFLVILIVGILFLLLLNNKNNIFTIIEDGAWCWFQDPRAVNYDGKFSRTYFGFVNKKGDIKIAYYDNKTKETKIEIVHESLQIDDHAAPSILILNDGRIMIFYSAHTGDYLYYKISKNSEDISSWNETRKIKTNITPESGGYDWKFTYSNPVQLSDEKGKIYLFWRGGNGQPTFSISNDADNWSQARNLFYVSGERPYLKVFSNDKDRIYFTFTDGHPDEVDFNNIYFAYYEKGGFYKADGTFIKKIDDLPLYPSEIDLIYDSIKNNMKSWNWDISIDKSGNPVIVYAVFPAINNHKYRYAVWDGFSWDDNEITSAGNSIEEKKQPYYSGGITIDKNNHNILYLSKEINEINEIEKWTTNDNGYMWKNEKVTSKSHFDNFRPFSPKNKNNSGIQAFWMSGKYNYFTDYETSILTIIK
ncbi:MAG: BNR-4 repeat-containing protein [Parcubacteria group bacterium]